MKEEILKNGPGVLASISTDKGYKGALLIYDGDVFREEIELIKPSPEKLTKNGWMPGIELNLFFTHSIRVIYPKKAKIKFAWH